MTPTLELDLRDPDTLRAAVGEHLPVGGLLLKTEAPPAMFATVDIAVRLTDGDFRFLKGQVVNHAPGGVFAVLNDSGAAASLLDAAQALLNELPEPEPEPAPEREPEPEADQESAEEETPERSGPLASGATRPSWELLDNTSDVPLHKQIAQLTVNDKLRLARQANRPVRRILIRDLEKRVHLEVVKNPQVKDDEAIEYAGTGGLSPTALEWLSSQSRYVKNKRMVMTLITNPMTPPRVAKRLLDKLTHRELIKVMRSPRSREAIIRECRKRLMKAGIL
jgi:hypothetical protein